MEDPDPYIVPPPVEAADRATVAAGFVSGMLSGWRSGGGKPEALMVAVGVDPRVLVDQRVRVPIEGYAALYNALVAELGDEAFGLLSQPMRPGSFEFLCRGVLTSATLDEALERAARFLSLVAPDLPVAIRRTA